MHVYNLLTVENGRLSGPMGPVMFAQEVCKALGTPMHGLARVVWDDECTMQLIDDEGGYDTVVFLERYKNDRVLRMFLDTGLGGIPVALFVLSDKTITFTGIYEKSTAFYKPSEAEVRAVFECIAADMSLIEPKRTKDAA